MKKNEPINQIKVTENLKKLNILQLLGKVVELTNDMKLSLFDLNSKKANDINALLCLNEISSRLGLDIKECLILAVLVDQCHDSRIDMQDIASHFSVKPIKILSDYYEALDNLVKRNIIATHSKYRDEEVRYCVPRKTIDCLKRGALPEVPSMANLTAREYFRRITKCFTNRKEEECTYSEMCTSIAEIVKLNKHLAFYDCIVKLNIQDDDLLLFLFMIVNEVVIHSPFTDFDDLSDVFEQYIIMENVSRLEDGTHVLMEKGLVENKCEDGQAVPDSWVLSKKTKKEILAELRLRVCETTYSGDVIRHTEVAEKRMFYTDAVSRQVEELQSLLQPERMARIQHRLKEQGMRTGFACIFYGSPGTGKTETVMQLAKQCERDVMMVDIPSIRSKWVGETERNVKDLFDRYANLVKDAERAPILLFNEADAILNKRFEGGVHAVDKMENAMQNIILQQMESLEGIMIATTNLTGNLDDAFERRFLYKIEFEKPTVKERASIWKSMLPMLTEGQAYVLASEYSFSGGQIENIARKELINSIIADRDGVDMSALKVSCSEEFIKKRHNSIGFKL